MERMTHKQRMLMVDLQRTLNRMSAEADTDETFLGTMAEVWEKLGMTKSADDMAALILNEVYG